MGTQRPKAYSPAFGEGDRLPIANYVKGLTRYWELVPGIPAYARGILSAHQDAERGALHIEGDSSGLAQLADHLIGLAEHDWGVVLSRGGPNIALFPEDSRMHFGELSPGSVFIRIRMRPDPPPVPFDHRVFQLVGSDHLEFAPWPDDGWAQLRQAPDGKRCELVANWPALLALVSHTLSLALPDVRPGSVVRYLAGRQLKRGSDEMVLGRVGETAQSLSPPPAETGRRRSSRKRE